LEAAPRARDEVADSQLDVSSWQIPLQKSAVIRV
jgi:hypothetical protein